MASATHYLSQLVGKPVFEPQGRPVGRLGDLVVRLSGPFPPVTGLLLRIEGGPGVGPVATYLHWEQVSSVSAHGISLASARLDLQRFRRRSGELLAELDLLDKQVIDVNGVKLVRVNDVQLVATGTGGSDLRLAGIDVGLLGLLRRVGLERIALRLARPSGRSAIDRVIPWESIEPVGLSELPVEHGGAVATDAGGGPLPPTSPVVRLTHEKLAGLHAADVADLVAQLGGPERATILESLDTEVAAEALGELDPAMRADVLEDLPTDAAVDILAELPPDEAADALAEVSEERVEELLSGLEEDDAEAVRSLMSYPENTAAAMMTTRLVALQGTMSAQETIDALRRTAPPADEVFYVYVIDSDEHIVGVLSLRDLVVSPPERRLSEIALPRDDVVSVVADAPREEVLETLEKYNLLALPVVDPEDRLLGVVTVDDALGEVVRRPRRWFSGGV